MGRYGPASMMGAGGYRWMMGGAHAPGWMAGSGLPGYMMGSSADPGEVMGSLFGAAPGPRVNSAQATQLASQMPAGATVDRATKRITFSGSPVTFAAVAGPAAADDKLEVAGLVEPTVIVPANARETIQFVNADRTSAHGLVIDAAGASPTWMPMMTSPPAFAAAAVWFLGDATSAGAHTAAVTFTAAAAGNYQYLCPLPSHAQKGMAGTSSSPAEPGSAGGRGEAEHAQDMGVALGCVRSLELMEVHHAQRPVRQAESAAREGRRKDHVGDRARPPRLRALGRPSTGGDRPDLRDRRGGRGDPPYARWACPWQGRHRALPAQRSDD
jgi:plastocyanin